MPNLITTKYNSQCIIPYSVNSGKIAAYTPVEIATTKLFQFRKTEAPFQVCSNGRCIRAAMIAESEWEPDKVYETKGENRGADVTRYRFGVDLDASWCATFFNYLYNPEHKSGQNVLGLDDYNVRSTQAILRAAKSNRVFESAKSGYIPQVGDALIWRTDKNHNTGHIGIIVEVRPNGSFVAIEGNSNDKVQKIEYNSIEDAMIRISSSGNTQTLMGFVNMTKYCNDHYPEESCNICSGSSSDFQKRFLDRLS